MKPAALVTGGAIRVGRAFALGLAKAGHDIAIHYNSSHQAAETTLNEIKALGVNAVAIPADLGDAHAIPTLIQNAKDTLPHLGILVNSASAYQHASIMESNPDLFDEQFAVNLKAPFFLTKAFTEICQQGHVVNIIDNKINFNQFQYAAYLLSKKALAEFTTMAAMELAPDIRVNGIAPGVTLPAETRTEEYVKWRIEGIPLKMQGTTDHLVKALIYLQNNDFVTGQIMTVDGGESILHVGRNFHSHQGEGS